MNHLRYLRLSRTLTQRKMAELMSVPLRTYQRWESQPTVKPHILALAMHLTA